MSRSRKPKAQISVATVMPRSTLYPDSLHCSNSAGLPVIDGKFDIPISISSKINPTKAFKVSDFKPNRGAWICRTGSPEHAQNKSRPSRKAGSTAKNKSGEATKLLVTVNVIGSPGPLRFLVYSHDTVKRVIQLALKAYAREGRVPLLGVNYKTVDLCCANNDFEALGLNEPAGRLGTRNFLLYKKKQGGGNTQERRNMLISLPVKFWTSMVNTFTF
ncbi:hypothetical protein O6H91_07G057000 [Diphasiastrum complanatum]|uniref:Uncharacterized protein n=1 Tax=Diphasiastrum complanatum TaxID=34168 RepID=A0ACC2D5U4_DIPCM|nr:hypothetical protein O6H91_Y365200 [Diphasiastrum complanatum]KAJ7549518.1 hypothetical protein O6H91_07G057000 [Diphasiastrum complanatum]